MGNAIPLLPTQPSASAVGSQIYRLQTSRLDKIGQSQPW
jgi:hypothetical protein